MSGSVSSHHGISWWHCQWHSSQATLDDTDGVVSDGVVGDGAVVVVVTTYHVLIVCCCKVFKPSRLMPLHNQFSRAFLSLFVPPGIPHLYILLASV